MPFKKVMTEVSDVVALNTAAFAISFSNIELMLKIALLILTFIYTLDKWLYHRRNRDKINKDE